ncbi:hypothetical protein [Novosphingobium acidiphilum]|uniref:hypothetical protein n=1 Tax=Novosphingobium acidiphilum TaxID=505248 RepID=UPI000491495E|nr:hypothetical protein [Novosphingobium acidiphilum]
MQQSNNFAWWQRQEINFQAGVVRLCIKAIKLFFHRIADEFSAPARFGQSVYPRKRLCRQAKGGVLADRGSTHG